MIYNGLKQKIELKLNSYDNLLIANLNKLTDLNYNPNIKILNFEIFIEPTRFEINVRMFSMSKDGNEIFNNDKDKYFAGSIDIVEDVYYLNDFESPEERNIYEENYELIEKDIIGWFINCWKQSDCIKIGLPMFVNIHDNYNLYDVNENKWTSFDLVYEDE